MIPNTLLFAVLSNHCVNLDNLQVNVKHFWHLLINQFKFQFRRYLKRDNLKTLIKAKAISYQEMCI